MSEQTSKITKIENKIPFQKENVQLCETSKFYCQTKNSNINIGNPLTTINVNTVTQNEKSDKIPISDRIYNTKSLCGNN
jgi:hypothetical protein